MLDDKPIDKRVEFFDLIANQWDGWHDFLILNEKFNQTFDSFDLKPRETVLDVGCGTGNLTRALLKRLDSEGRVVAVDISPVMLARAQFKIRDARVSWLRNSAESICVKDQLFDRIFCFSAWPHFADRSAVVDEFWRILKPRGYLHLFHFISRDDVNQIHAAAHPSVQADLLEPVHQLASLFEKGGFKVSDTVDNNSRYAMTARKMASP